MNTTALPGQLAFADEIAKPWRDIGTEAGKRYKIVPIQIAAPANLDDATIIEAINFALTYTQIAEGPIAHDWQFLARDGAVGDNDHFREAIIDEDDLFAGAPQAIFENWYLIPDGSTSSPTDGTQCPQCERFFTDPEDTAAIGDHALCTTCLIAWRMTAAGSASSRTAAKDDAGDGGDGYSEQPPFLPIPEWWAARGIDVPTEDAPPDANVTVEEPAAETNSPTVLLARQYFSAQNDDFNFEGPFNDEVAAILHWPANDTEYARIIEVLAPLGAKVEIDYWEMSTDIDEDTLKRTWEFEEPTGG